MRTAALVLVVALLAACEQDPGLKAYPDASTLYDVSGAEVVCRGPSAASGDPAGTDAACEWSCISVDGQAVRWMRVDFSRASAAEPWAVKWTTYDMGACG